MSCQMSLELGAYVLDALDAAQAHAVERHLAGCSECNDELGSLAFTASLLSLLGPEDVEQLEGPDPVDARTATGRPGRVRGARGLRGRAVAVAAAALLGASVVVPTISLLGGHDDPPAATVLHAVGPASHARADVSLTAEDDGTGLHLTLTGAPRRGWCSLVARAGDGRSEIAATWPTNGYGRVDVSGTTAIPAAELDELAVVTGRGRTLVRIPVPHPTS